jgi:hypothetical protein
MSETAPTNSNTNNETNNNSIGVCTIVAKNYLPYARTLMHSIKQHNPEFKCFVLLADKVEGYFEPADEDFTLDLSCDLDIPDNNLFHFKYSVLELCTAVKPYYLEQLLTRHQLSKLMYFDPDIMVFDELSPLTQALDEHSIILTPHLLDPLDDGKRPSEREIMQAGVYNLGFIGISELSKSLLFLKWWQEKLYNDCVVDIPGNLFVDQRWVDLVPGMFCQVGILRNPGLNVAYWNLSRREIQKVGDNYLVNGQPLRFFHFSGFDAENPENFSRHQDRFTVENLGDVNNLVSVYQKNMLNNGYRESKKWPYVYGNFQDGSKIPDFCRRMVRDDLELQKRLSGKPTAEVEAAIIEYMNEPFEEGAADRVLISRLLHFIYLQRADLRSVYPDLERSNRLEVVYWFLSAAEREYKIPDIFVKPVAQSCQEREAYELDLSRKYNFKQQAEESGAYARKLESALLDLQGSLSWKITAPLRKLSSMRKNKMV